MQLTESVDKNLRYLNLKCFFVAKEGKTKSKVIICWVRMKVSKETFSKIVSVWSPLCFVVFWNTNIRETVFGLDCKSYWQCTHRNRTRKIIQFIWFCVLKKFNFVLIVNEFPVAQYFYDCTSLPCLSISPAKYIFEFETPNMYNLLSYAFHVIFIDSVEWI